MLNNVSAVPSLSDIAAVTGNDGFGGNNGWWILIILFAIFGGWGNNGRYDNNYGGAAENYVLASDFATLQRQIDSGINSLERKGDTINAGLCDGFYAMNTGLLNGFSTAQLTAMQNANALQAQLSNCCCENRQAIAQVRYDMATDTCSITNAINQAAQNIIQNDNNNFRQLHDENVAIQMANKDATIAELAAKLQAMNLNASQAAQSNYLINHLRPLPIPAYPVPNPFEATAVTTTA